jgi:hypothetical protein
MRRFLSIASVSFAIVTGLVAGPIAASAPPPGLLPPTVPLAMALSVGQPDGDWRGRFCTTASCTGRSPRSGSDALGFGAAVLAAGWIARRRRALEG